jgi:hypothetical protein
MPLMATKTIQHMRAILFLLLFLVHFTLSAQFSPELTKARVDVVYLASDYLEGRAAGESGETLAAEYIAMRFAELGLAPKGNDQQWYQAFEFSFSANPHASAKERRTGKNVIGYLDNKATHTVVIGAHYDHVGYGFFGSRSSSGPDIHNGADDNASGVAALLQLAAALKASEAKNNNYLFIAFSGEEMGLHGSKHFVAAPTINLSQVNYMINMDMVGRLNEEKTLIINGAGTSPAWKPAIERLEVGGIKARTHDSGVGPSDHTSFYLKDIPVLHFFTGQHSDYHTPNDEAHLINFEGLLAVSDFILALIESLDEQGKLAFTKTQDANQERQAARFKVSLGVLPDYGYDGEGLLVEGVIDGRPAALAGLQAGDIIVRIGDQVVSDVYSYMEGLSKFEAGDKTIVVIRREGKEWEKTVTF